MEMKDEIMEDFDVNNPTSLFNSVLLELSNTKMMLDTKVDYRKRYGLFYLSTNDVSLHKTKLFIIILSLIINVLVLVNDDPDEREKAKIIDL